MMRCVAVVVVCGWSVRAWGREAGEELELRVVGGVAVVRGVVESPRGKVTGHFVVDVGWSGGVMLPEHQAEALGLKVGERGRMRLGEVTLEGVEVREGSSSGMRGGRGGVGGIVGRLSAENAGALREVPVLGVLGWGAFGGRALELDVGGGSLKVLADVGEPHTGVGVARWEGEWQGEWGGGHPLLVVGEKKVGLDLSRWESAVAEGEVERLGVGTDRPAEVRIGEIDLLRSGAFEPGRMNADLALGVGILSQLRVTVVPGRREMWFERLRPAPSMEVEQAFYLALHRGDATGIVGFIRRFPDHPKASEATLELLRIRMNGGGGEGLTEAVRMFAESFPVERRSARLLGLADQLLDRGRGGDDTAAGVILDVAGEYAEKDLDGRATFSIHARRGLLAMRAGDMESAGRLLMSAAFGLKGDAKVDLWLGQMYARQGKWDRAWLRLVDAALAREPQAGAIRELDQLIRREGFRESMPVEEMMLMLEGRVPEMSPPTVRESDEAVGFRLVEVFLDDSSAGSAGQQLAFEALREYYRGSGAEFLAHHFGPAGNTKASIERARSLGIKSVPALVVDGELVSSVPSGIDGARSMFGEQLTKLRGRVLSGEAGIELSVRGGEGELKFEVELTKHEGVAEVLVYLRQVQVFAMGGNGLAKHAGVSRGRIGPEEGSRLIGAGERKSATVKLSLREASERLEVEGDEARSKQNVKGESMRTVPLNWEGCEVVVVARDVETKRVIAAMSARLPQGVTK